MCYTVNKYLPPCYAAEQLGPIVDEARDQAIYDNPAAADFDRAVAMFKLGEKVIF